MLLVELFDAIVAILTMRSLRRFRQHACDTKSSFI